MFLERPKFIEKIKKSFRSHPIVALLGPRQCGKTTLARHYAREFDKVYFFDLEDPTDVAALQNPKTLLEPLQGLIVIDEIQRVPELFPVLRVLVDQPTSRKQILILGSASRDLIRQSSETLAGRIAYLELTPFTFSETGDMHRLWLRGGFPHSYLATSIEDSAYWRQQYVSTFLERDIPNLGIHIPPVMLRRFWTMLVHYHGQTFNASEIGKSLGISDATVKRYLDILTGAFMMRQLSPWVSNLKKRQVKRPKTYFRDSGLLHILSGITDEHSLLHHPKLGASWEGFALEEIIRSYGAAPEECFFWGVHEEAELDLLIVKADKMYGFEVKYSDAPAMTKSLQIAKKFLQLESIQIIYPGAKNYSLEPGVEVKGFDFVSCN